MATLGFRHSTTVLGLGNCLKSLKHKLSIKVLIENKNQNISITGTEPVDKSQQVSDRLS